MAAKTKPSAVSPEPSPTGASAARGLERLANALRSGPAAPSIATLTDDQAMQLGQAAGQQAFQSAIDSGVPVPLKVGTEVVTVVRFQRRT
jgi:hypothetical protein